MMSSFIWIVPAVMRTTCLLLLNVNGDIIHANRGLCLLFYGAGSMWMIFGLFKSEQLLMSLNYSRLISANSVFIKQIQVNACCDFKQKLFSTFGFLGYVFERQDNMLCVIYRYKTWEIQVQLFTRFLKGLLYVIRWTIMRLMTTLCHQCSIR